jgi:hypothetical protein
MEMEMAHTTLSLSLLPWIGPIIRWLGRTYRRSCRCPTTSIVSRIPTSNIRTPLAILEQGVSSIGPWRCSVSSPDGKGKRNTHAPRRDERTGSASVAVRSARALATHRVSHGRSSCQQTPKRSQDREPDKMTGMTEIVTGS